jgi:hypothetical protein
VVWTYRKIALNEHPRKSDDIDLLCWTGEDRWELVTILPNNIAYLKRWIDPPPRPHQEPVEQALAVNPKYRDPATGETWSGRGRMAGWLKRKQDAGEDVEAYRVT